MYVRSTAVKALAQLADKGDQHAIAAVAALFEDNNENVRSAGVEALAQPSENGDKHSIIAVAGLLEDGNEGEVCSDRSPSAVCSEGRPACLPCSGCVPEDVRSAELIAPVQLAEKGDTLAITAVGALLGECREEYRPSGIGSRSAAHWAFAHVSDPRLS